MKLAGQEARRIDQWLQGNFPGKSRSTFQRLIREGRVLLRGEKCDCKSPVHEGDAIEIEFPAPRPSELIPEAMPLDILFEDDHLLVLNKPAGVVVHPGAGNSERTLAHALLHHCRGKLSGIGGVERPGIVHRLDKETSGCLVVAKTDAAHQGLTAAFQARQVEKIYLALVWGIPGSLAGKVDRPIGRHPVHRKKMAISEKGKGAVTHWKVREKYSDAALLECRLETGRTHQIRVHLASIGHSLVGDRLYGGGGKDRQPVLGLPPGSSIPRNAGPAAKGGKGPSRQMLHAWRLGFKHPVDHKPIQCEAPWPLDFEEEMKRQKEKIKRQKTL